MEDAGTHLVLAARIADQLRALGLSERKASLEATGQPDAIRFIRTRGTMPSAARLMRIANVLRATPEYLTGRADNNDWDNDKSFIKLAATIDDEANRQFKSGRVVPVLGTVAYSDNGFVERTEIAKDTVVYGFTPEVLAFAAAPLGTKVGKLGAFYPADTTMSPVFEPHVPAVFAHNEEAKVGEYALIFFKHDEPNDRHAPKFFILRRLVDRGEGWLTVEQHTPATRRKLSMNGIEHTRRVLSLRDYVAPADHIGTTVQVP